MEGQSQSQIMKNVSSHVDSDQEEQVDLLNQMLGLAGDSEMVPQAFQEQQ